MIELMTGKPGSGKTLDACRQIRSHLKRGLPVVCNFPINVDERWRGDFYYASNRELTPDKIIQFAEWYFQDKEFGENKILIAVDESQLLWNSRQWNSDPNRMAWLELMSQHRKWGVRFMLICQSDIMIDKQFRTLVEYETHHVKMTGIGAFGLLLKIIAFGHFFMANTWYYGTDVRVDRYFFRYNKKLGEMYDTRATFKQLNAGTAKAAPANN